MFYTNYVWKKEETVQHIQLEKNREYSSWIMELKINTTPGELIDKLATLELEKQKPLPPSKKTRVLDTWAALGQVYRQNIDVSDEHIALAEESLLEVVDELEFVEQQLEELDDRNSYEDEYVKWCRVYFKLLRKRKRVINAVNTYLGIDKA